MDKFKKIIPWVGISLVSIICVVVIVYASIRINSDMQCDIMRNVLVTEDEALDRYETIAKAKQQEQIARETKATQETPEADTGAPSETCTIKSEDGTVVYLIQKGDTLSEISAKVLYSVDELAEYNKIKDVNLIYADSALRIPNGE